MKKRIYLVTFLSLFTLLVFGQHASEKKSTASENVSILKKEFVIPNLNTISHKIWVYVPPNYYQTSKKYPVIYMHDAQNLFDNTTSFIGEWGVDESLNAFFKNTGKGFIVVGIAHGGEERINEYTPWPHKKYGGGKGKLYVNFLVNTLKPYIDAHYRTKKQAKHTAIIGSSLGGLLSYYGGLQYPTIFGKIGALSPSFWFADEVFDFTKTHGNTKKVRLYLLAGEKEGADMVADTKKITQLLQATGFPSKNIKTNIHPQGEHNEQFWKSEFLNVVSWLYNIN